ncbi:IS256 family transposase [Sediminispirochaeta smaragdinae]|uniref:Mutator family transposase n=1 Tax=Sediminispirochaeta smaragdinae (strain DSM 11293 / JCM 15392 / SEBR 4228) TaxID=573413 RepID=E1R1E4_SEDSS|nr:IS256 family transposase [Sediminispirochaeta smaragdinae]ADK81085.1 transposase mutator type [Sediminispirochaeta smaragdinae DSM 11293]
MPGKIIEINEEEVKAHLGEFVRETVEETLNAMLEAEAEQLVNAQKHERNTDRKGYRAGHYNRKLLTKAGEVTLQMPKLKKVTFETAIIERYKRREISVEEAMVEMYLAGVSVRRVEDITEALWGAKVSPGTISNLNKKIYEEIEKWRNLPLESHYGYVYLDGIWMKRSWAGEVRNVSVLVAIGVNQDGFREIIGVAEGTKEDKDSWQRFLRYLKERGLESVDMFISDKSLGLVESIPEFYPQARWQRCVVHFYRNVFSFVPHGKVKEVATMLKAIHAQENKEEAIRKKDLIAQKLMDMKLHKAAALVREGSLETFSYYHFPVEHWKRIRTNNGLERIMREIRRRTRVIGSFPDGESALMLVAARLRHISGSSWSERKYLNMDLLIDYDQEEHQVS